MLNGRERGGRKEVSIFRSIINGAEGGKGKGREGEGRAFFFWAGLHKRVRARRGGVKVEGGRVNRLI